MTRTRFEVTLGQWHMDIDTLLKNYTKRTAFYAKFQTLIDI
jgi:hypothetical protein